MVFCPAVLGFCAVTSCNNLLALKAGSDWTGTIIRLAPVTSDGVVYLLVPTITRAVPNVPVAFVAVMVVLPGAIAVNEPFAAIVPTELLLFDHVIAGSVELNCIVSFGKSMAMVGLTPITVVVVEIIATLLPGPVGVPVLVIFSRYVAIVFTPVVIAEVAPPFTVMVTTDEKLAEVAFTFTA